MGSQRTVDGQRTVRDLHHSLRREASIGALIRPFLTMVVFTVIFGKIARLPSDGAAPYALMVFAGMLPWSFFSTALADAANCLLSDANLISKVYFPRLIIPVASVLPGLIDCHSHLLQAYDRNIGGDDNNIILTVAQMSTAKRASIYW